MAWQELPQGQDLRVVAPNFYAVIAQVSTSHSRDDILAQAQKHGLNVFQYQEDAPTSDGYRQVALQAQATSTSGITIPWSPGLPASLIAHYHLTRAWWAPPSDAPAGSVTPPTPPPASNTGIIVGVFVAAVAGIGAYLWYRRR